jgi:hypothetical protein
MLSFIEQKFQEWLKDIKQSYAYILSSSEVASRNAFEAGYNTHISMDNIKLRENNIIKIEIPDSLSYKEVLEQYPNEARKHFEKQNKRLINWTAFKPSGKYAYSGTSLINLKDCYFDLKQLVKDIDDNQNEVIKGTLTDGYYTIYVDGDDGNPDTNNTIYPFITRLIIGEKHDSSSSH